MNKKILFLTIGVLFLIGCPENKKVTVPPILADCLGPNQTLTATVTGSGTSLTSGAVGNVNTSATITNSSGPTINWTTAGTSTSTDPISGTSGSGTVTQVAGGYAISVTYPSGKINITITGTITPGSPCTCTNGTWTAKAGGVTIGSGSWTIP